MPPPPPNAMMAALQQSRQENPVSSSGPMPGGPPQAPQPAMDPAKMMSAITDLSSKVDKILEALSGQYRGKDPETPENDGNEAKGE